MKHVVFDCDGTLLDTSGPRFVLFPGIRELLKELSGQFTLYVWTARGRASTLRVLGDNNVLSLFVQINTADDDLAKPNPAGLFTLLNTTPKHSIAVIGDSSADMLGAKSFGVMAIGATWNKISSSTSLKEAGADFIVSHPMDCSKLLIEKLRGDHV